jgi:uncharacterized protein YjbI with pentapeptide repeats
VSITDSEFTSEVEFSHASFQRSASFARSKFAQKAEFSGACIHTLGDFRGAQFSGKTRFLGADFKGQGIFLKTTFGDLTHFNGAHFGREATFASSQFKKDASFDRILTDGPLVFSPELTPGEQGNPVCFHGEVTFIAARIQGQADFRSAQFLDDVSFDMAQFDSSVHFDPFETEAEREPPSHFNGKAHFIGTIFNSEAFFSNTVFKGDAVFQRARFKLGADFDGIQFWSDADFMYAKSEYKVDFVESVFHKDAIFEDSNLSEVFFRRAITKEPREPQFLGKVKLQRWTGKSLSVAWRELKGKMALDDLIRTYIHLEAILRVSGREREADEMYYERRNAERRNLWHEKAYFRSIMNGFYWFIAGYGVQPYRLFWLLALFLILGTVMFHLPGAVTYQEVSLRTSTPYQLSWLEALSVSVNQLLLGNIPWGSKWKLSENPIPFIPVLPFTFYATIHRLASSFLLAILLAFIRDLLHFRKGV